MSPHMLRVRKRKRSLGRHKSNFTPWRRISKEDLDIGGDVISKLENRDPRFQMFSVYEQNNHLDIYTKRAALTASPSVVGLQSQSRDGAILQRSGFIVESGSTHSVILTSACLLNCSAAQNNKADIKISVHLSDGRSFDGEIEAQDFLYNLVAVRIHTDALLPTISSAQLKDGITVNPSHQVNEESFHLRPHSRSFELIPGDSVIALGRFILNYGLMAAPGVFSVDQCEYVCEELFMASCRITECGIGGPLINRFGEAIGICLHACSYTAFLPINIASTWWEHCKTYRSRRSVRRNSGPKSQRVGSHTTGTESRRLRRPRGPMLGMKVTNLYAVPVHTIEEIAQRFPDIVKAVIVEEVVRGSAAESAGIKHHDLIIEFAGKRVQSVLELFEDAWNKVGESVDLTVIRASTGARLHLSMMVGEART